MKLSIVASEPDTLLNEDESRTDLVPKARRLMETLAEFGRDEGVPLIAFDDPSLPLFRQLPRENQELVVTALEGYVDLHVQLRREREPVMNNLRSVWSMLSRLKWRHSSDLFQTLRQDDVVEIYTANRTQIFCTFNMFKCTSYSLEELYSLPWFQLFTRSDASIQATQLEWDEKMMAGEVKSTVRVPIPDYEVREIFGRRRYINMVEHRCISPLTDRKGELVGFIHVCRATIVGREPIGQA